MTLSWLSCVEYRDGGHQELVEALGAEATLVRAQKALERGEPVVAVQLGEAVDRFDPDTPGISELMVSAHRSLLELGGESNFWENGWLRTQIARWQRAESDESG